MPKYICDKCKNEYEGKFCPECGDKTTKKDKEVMTDKEIINNLINDTKNKMKNIELHNKVSIVFFIISFIVATIGMYHKSIDSIIDSNLFIGYMVMAGSLLISGVLLYKNKN